MILTNHWAIKAIIGFILLMHLTTEGKGFRLTSYMQRKEKNPEDPLITLLSKASSKNSLYILATQGQKV